MRKLYYKNKLLNALSKPFENRRLFTPLRLAIDTLQHYRLWPEKVIALDPFCQTGLQWTRVIAPMADYLEMWDIDPTAVSYARKSFKQATVVCGDSIQTFKNGNFGRRDFNFVLMDSPVPFRFPDGSFEHFGFFDSIFRHTASRTVLIFDVVPDIQLMLNLHPHSPEFVNEWKSARKTYYQSSDGAYVSPDAMIAAYRQKIAAAGYNVRYIAYNARNRFFGIITVAIER